MSEKGFQPDWFSRPGDTLSEMMTIRAVSIAELSKLTKLSAITLAEVLSGATPIDAEIASRLSKAIGGTQKFWLTRQATYDAALTRAAEKLPTEVSKLWMQEFSKKLLADYGFGGASRRLSDQVKACLAYFGVSGPEEWHKRYADYPADVVFRTSSAFETKMGSLSLWLRQGELRASAVATNSWNSKKLKEAIPSLRRLSKRKTPTAFVPELRAMCAAAGVAVVFVRAPSGCRASGASRFISPEKAMVMLSFRHLSDDHFWFTFFHEVGHLLLHGKDATFVDGDETARSGREKEANAFAACSLVPLERHDEMFSLAPRMNSIIRFAVSVGIAPGIVVGQMQHAKSIGPEQLNYLKRRYTWPDIEAAFS